jgi:hypothetical protein
VASNPPLDLTLTPIHGEGRTLEQWLTTFHLVSVLVDPYTNESAWILDTAARIMRNFTGAAVRVNWVVTGTAEDATAFLGPLADEFLTFADPERLYVKALGLERLPAFVFLRVDGQVVAAAEGWNAMEWRRVAEAVADATAWTRAVIPAPGDPQAYAGTLALA